MVDGVTSGSVSGTATGLAQAGKAVGVGIGTGALQLVRGAANITKNVGDGIVATGKGAVKVVKKPVAKSTATTSTAVTLDDELPGDPADDEEGKGVPTTGLAAERKPSRGLSSFNPLRRKKKGGPQ